MTETAARLKDELLRLSEEDRVELTHVLWDSIEMPDEDRDEDAAAWTVELERRVADLEAGRSIAEPVDKVFAELREEARREQRSR